MAGSGKTEGGQAKDESQIPDKLYFRIGEVSRLVGVKPYVLRYWETEFPKLNPKKSGTGHRQYRRKEVEQLIEIRRLLHEQRYTIDGARQKLAAARRERAAAQAAPAAPPSPTKAAKPQKPPVAQAEQRLEARQGFLFGDPMEVLRAVYQELEQMRDELDGPPLVD